MYIIYIASTHHKANSNVLFPHNLVHCANVVRLRPNILRMYALRVLILSKFSEYSTFALFCTENCIFKHYSYFMKQIEKKYIIKVEL